MAATRRERILIGTHLNLCPQQRAEVPHAGESIELCNGVHQLPGARLAKDRLQQFQGFFLYFVSGQWILRPALESGHPLFQLAAVSRDYLDDGLAFRSCAAQLRVANERDLLLQIEHPGSFMRSKEWAASKVSLPSSRVTANAYCKLTSGISRSFTVRAPLSGRRAVMQSTWSALSWCSAMRPSSPSIADWMGNP